MSVILLYSFWLPPFSFLFLWLESQAFNFSILLHTSQDCVSLGLGNKRTEREKSNGDIFGTTVSLARDESLSLKILVIYLAATAMATAAGLPGSWDWRE